MPKKSKPFSANPLIFTHNGFFVTIYFAQFNGQIVWIFNRIHRQEIWNEDRVLDFLGISARTARNWRTTGKGDKNALLLLYLYATGRLLPGHWSRKGLEFNGDLLTQKGAEYKACYRSGFVSNSALTISAT